jgi:hypothetical protein
VLYSFAGGSAGAAPVTDLVSDAKGVLYGTTENGGPSVLGAMFSLTPPVVAGESWTARVLYFFAGGSDGTTPPPACSLVTAV